MESKKKSKKNKNTIDKISISTGFLNWFKSNKIVLKFVGYFGLFIASYYILINIGWLDGFLDFYKQSTAVISSGILNILGSNTYTDASKILTTGFSLEIGTGCEGTEPIAIFLSALFAFPMKFKFKLPGIISGILVLYILNQIRIVILFYVGISAPNTLRTLHDEVFPIIFIFIAIILWGIWLGWSVKKSKNLKLKLTQT